MKFLECGLGAEGETFSLFYNLNPFLFQQGTEKPDIPLY